MLRHAARPGDQPGGGAAAAGDPGAAGAPSTALGPGPGMLSNAEHLAILRQRLLRQRAEFEALLERVADEARRGDEGPSGSVGGGGGQLPADLRRLMDRHLSQVGVSWA